MFGEKHEPFTVPYRLGQGHSVSEKREFNYMDFECVVLQVLGATELSLVHFIYQYTHSDCLSIATNFCLINQ